MPDLPTILQQTLSFFPSPVLAGVCSGQDWRLVAHNAALVRFFREPDAEKPFLPGNSDGGIAGESLFALLYRAGLNPAAGSIRTSRPDETLVFSARERSYALIWRFLHPAAGGE